MHAINVCKACYDLYRRDSEEIARRREPVPHRKGIPAQGPGPESLAYRVALKSLGRPWEERKAVQLDPSTLDEYAGVYRFSETTLRAISCEGDKLFSQRSDGPRVEIQAASRDDFFYEDSESRIHFRRDAQGKITCMDVLQRLAPDEIGAKTDEPFPAERQAIQVDPGLYDAGDRAHAAGERSRGPPIPGAGPRHLRGRRRRFR